jgi:hypothetical protein
MTGAVLVKLWRREILRYISVLFCERFEIATLIPICSKKSQLLLE